MQVSSGQRYCENSFICSRGKGEVSANLHIIQSEEKHLSKLDPSPHLTLMNLASGKNIPAKIGRRMAERGKGQSTVGRKVATVLLVVLGEVADKGGGWRLVATHSGESHGCYLEEGVGHEIVHNIQL